LMLLFCFVLLISLHAQWSFFSLGVYPLSREVLS
jgi:hypothetical protein